MNCTILSFTITKTQFILSPPTDILRFSFPFSLLWQKSWQIQEIYVYLWPNINILNNKQNEKN